MTLQTVLDLLRTDGALVALAGDAISWGAEGVPSVCLEEIDGRQNFAFPGRVPGWVRIVCRAQSFSDAMVMARRVRTVLGAVEGVFDIGGGAGNEGGTEIVSTDYEIWFTPA